MATTVKLKNSVTTTAAPSSLVQGEVAVNITDKKVWVGNAASGVVQILGAGATVAGTTATLTGDASISGLTVGKGGGAVATNTAVGYQANYSNTTGTSITAVGYRALYSNTGDYNSAFGVNALYTNSSGIENTALGRASLYSNTTGSDNTIVGMNSAQSNTTGSYNVAVGQSALFSNTTASNNTAVGYQASYSNTTGNQIACFGKGAGYTNTTGTDNTLLGFHAGYTLNSGGNVAVGSDALSSCTSGSLNTAIGYSGGNAITTGSKNTILGRYTGNQGGLDIRTASNYIVLSDGDGNPRVNITEFGVARFDTVTNTATAGGVVLLGPTETSQPRINIGHATGTASGAIYTNFLYAGTVIGSITQTGTTAVLYNTTSDYRLKTNATPIQNALATIQALNPVSFTWVDGRPDNGFIAHEIQAVIPNCVTGEKDAIDEDENPKYQQMDSSGVIPFLVKAIQELKAEFDAYKATHP